MFIRFRKGLESFNTNVCGVSLPQINDIDAFLLIFGPGMLLYSFMIFLLELYHYTSNLIHAEGK